MNMLNLLTNETASSFSIEAEWRIYVSKLTITGSDKGLSPGRRQAIIWTIDGILLIWPWEQISLKSYSKCIDFYSVINIQRFSYFHKRSDI